MIHFALRVAAFLFICYLGQIELEIIAAIFRHVRGALSRASCGSALAIFLLFVFG